MKGYTRNGLWILVFLWIASLLGLHRPDSPELPQPKKSARIPQSHALSPKLVVDVEGVVPGMSETQAINILKAKHYRPYPSRSQELLAFTRDTDVCWGVIRVLEIRISNGTVAAVGGNFQDLTVNGRVLIDGSSPSQVKAVLGQPDQVNKTPSGLRELSFNSLRVKLYFAEDSKSSGLTAVLLGSQSSLQQF